MELKQTAQHILAVVELLTQLNLRLLRRQNLADVQHYVAYLHVIAVKNPYRPNLQVLARHRKLKSFAEPLRDAVFFVLTKLGLKDFLAHLHLNLAQLAFLPPQVGRLKHERQYLGLSLLEIEHQIDEASLLMVIVNIYFNF